MLTRSLSVFILFIMLCAGTSASAADAFTSVDELSKWLTFYYQDPQPDKIPAAIRYFADSPVYGTNATIPTAAFFAALFKKDPVLTEKVFSELSIEGSANARVILMEALYLAGTPESRTLLTRGREYWVSPYLQKDLDTALNGLPTDIFYVDVNDINKGPLALDILWTTFSATGRKEPIQKILSVAPLAVEGKGSSMLVGAAANWSLGENARMHPRVLSICEEELATAQGVKKDLLEKIVSGAKEAAAGVPGKK